MSKRASAGTQLSWLDTDLPKLTEKIKAEGIRPQPVISGRPAVDLMERWRQFAILNWRHVLEESLQEGNERRSTYARWMLSTVLEAPVFVGKNTRKASPMKGLGI
jgi:hypothetical protein